MYLFVWQIQYIGDSTITNTVNYKINANEYKSNASKCREVLTEQVAETAVLSSKFKSVVFDAFLLL